MPIIKTHKFTELISTHPILLLSTRQGRSNTLTPLIWYMPLSIDPPMIGISIKPSSLTYHYIRNSGDFLLEIPHESMLKIVHFCGVNSGRFIDKFSYLNLRAGRAYSVSPLKINDCMAHIECRVREIMPMGNRPLLAAEVITLSVDSFYYQEETGWRPGVRLIYYEGGMNYRIGDEIIDMSELRPGMVPAHSMG